MIIWRCQHQTQQLKKKSKYSASQSILLVGDGDFSFSRALVLLLLPQLQKKQKLSIVATSYDSFKELMDKYGNTVRVNTSELRNVPGVHVIHKVDATQLDSDPRLSSFAFDRIIFNFPHLGGSKDEDVAANTEMLSTFFNAGRKMLRPFRAGQDPVPEIHVTLRDTAFYNKWDLRNVAADKSCSMKVSEVMPFESIPYVGRGYAPVRTNPAFREAPSLVGARLFILRPKGAELREDRVIKYNPVIKINENEEKEEGISEDNDGGEGDVSLRELLGLD